MDKLTAIRKDITAKKSSQRAKASAWFFKTGKGEYGEGDRFLGLTVPEQRRIAKKYLHLDLPDIGRLLGSPYHEFRFTALEILVFQYERGSRAEKNSVYRFYLAHARRVNNWDLVDTSCRYIVGDYLISRPRGILYRLAKSKNMWQRRIAVVSTFAFIARGDFADAFSIAEILLADRQDLIHKAVGWVLREIGKKNETALRNFLDAHICAMPRTALRYAIERFAPPERARYLKTRNAC